MFRVGAAAPCGPCGPWGPVAPCNPWGPVWFHEMTAVYAP